MKETCAHWGSAKLLEKYHPDKAVVNSVINQLSDNAIPHFKNISDHRQK